MGAYLSAPSTEKKSDDFSDCEKFRYGVSRMQGWRISMEDAHNYVPDIAENMSLFGVYDGHGGSEVALYCALHFADVLKDLRKFKDGNFEDALREAFMLVDKVLLEPETMRELKILADRDPDSGPVTKEEMQAVEYRQQEEEECEEDEMELLHEEATMSIEELLARYGKAANETKSKLEAHKAKIEKDNEVSGENCDAAVSSSSMEKKSNEEDSMPVVSEDVSSTTDSSYTAAPSGGSSSSDGEVISSTSDIKEKQENTGNSVSSTNASISVTSSSEVSSSKSEVQSEVTTMSNVSDGASMSSSSPSKEVEVAEADSRSGGEGEPGYVTENCDSSSAHAKIKPSGKIQPKIKGVKLGPSDEDFDPGLNSESEESEEGFDSDEAVEGSSESENEDDDEEDSEEDMDMVKIPSLGAIASTSEEPGKDSGTTAVVALLHKHKLFVANAGDSRCVLCRDGVAFDMSKDHKPEDESEIKRIKAAGGHVNMQGRVNGGLNLSRAIGDHCYKTNSSLDLENQMISAMPDIKEVTLRTGDNFMVLACDGIWNVLSSQDVVNFVLARLPPSESNKEIKLSSICEELMDTCLAPDTTGDGTGCDNMTCIIVKFDEEWLKKAPRNDNGGAAGDSKIEKIDSEKVDFYTDNVIEAKVNGKTDEDKILGVKRPRTENDVGNVIEVEDCTKKQKIG